MDQELADCADSGGSALISVTETNDDISYEGALHIELLSPIEFGECPPF